MMLYVTGADLHSLIWTKVNAWWWAAISWTRLIAVGIGNVVVLLHCDIAATDDVGHHIGLVVDMP